MNVVPLLLYSLFSTTVLLNCETGPMFLVFEQYTLGNHVGTDMKNAVQWTLTYDAKDVVYFISIVISI